MYELIKLNFSEYKVGRYYGDVSYGEKDRVKNDADIIVATYGSFSTGLDTHDIKYVISCDQCNKVQDNQAAGRARPLSDGTDAIYFMLVDYGFSYCKTKLRTRLQYLQETKSKDELPYRYIYNMDVSAGDNFKIAPPKLEDSENEQSFAYNGDP